MYKPVATDKRPEGARKRSGLSIINEIQEAIDK